MRNIIGMTVGEIGDLSISLGEKGYRGDQIAKWIYLKGVRSFDMMTDLPLPLRRRLEEIFEIRKLSLLDLKVARDGTRKYLFGLEDGMTVESVLIPEGKRVSACISTQVGCPIGCIFCASGLKGFFRNLELWEIMDQLIQMGVDFGSRISHVLFMGMGEPLANYDNFIKSIRAIRSGMGISMRRMTVSTSGLVEGIRRLADERIPVTLAISLHSADDKIRSRLVPLNARYGVSDLIDAARDYVERTKRRVTFECVLIRDINDSPADARKLGRAIKGILCHVNLIPLNVVEGLDFMPPDPRAVSEFKFVLEGMGIPTTIRRGRGEEIGAACGQLAIRSSGVNSEG